MKKATSFQDLIVWQKAHEFVLSVYRLSENFPKEERFGLTSQLRRAAVSIPANIAEGFKRTTKPDNYRFMNIAQGSLEECRYFIILAKDLKYIQLDGEFERIEEIAKLLNAYSKAILNSDS